MTKGTSIQSCPLCGQSVEYYVVDDGNRKHFLCKDCTQFQVAAAVEKCVVEAPADWRSRLSRMASAHPEGTTLVITLPPGRAEAGAHSTLTQEYVENSRLPG